MRQKTCAQNCAGIEKKIRPEVKAKANEKTDKRKIKYFFECFLVEV
jgi:hypothetical protein